MTQPGSSPVAAAAPLADLSAAPFRDDRLRQRLGEILQTLGQHPNCPFAKAFSGWTDTKAAYRFLAHPATTVAALLPALLGPTVALAGAGREVRILHDSTSFNYSQLLAATGLGYLNDSPTARGLHLHSSLALDEQGR